MFVLLTPMTWLSATRWSKCASTACKAMACLRWCSSCRPRRRNRMSRKWLDVLSSGAFAHATSQFGTLLGTSTSTVSTTSTAFSGPGTGASPCMDGMWRHMSSSRGQWWWHPNCLQGRCWVGSSQCHWQWHFLLKKLRRWGASWKGMAWHRTRILPCTALDGKKNCFWHGLGLSWHRMTQHDVTWHYMA